MKKIFTLCMVSLAFGLFAQEEETEEKKSFSFSGSIDAYYRANLTAPNDENAIAPGSSFANLPGFSLGMANIIASYEGEKIGRKLEQRRQKRKEAEERRRQERQPNALPIPEISPATINNLRQKSNRSNEVIQPSIFAPSTTK